MASSTCPLAWAAVAIDPPSSSATVAPPASFGVATPGQDVRAGEARDEAVGGCGGQLRRSPELAQPAVDQHADAVGERGGVAEVVRHEQRGEVQLREQVLQLSADDAAGLCVERRERLVEEQHGRVARQRASEGDTLALAAGDGIRALAREMVDAEALQQLAGPIASAERHVLPDRQVREQRVLLEDEADRPLVGVERDPLGAVEPRVLPERDAPAIGTAQPGDRPQHGRLPGSGRPDERDPLAPDVEREAQRVGAKADGDVGVERFHAESSL